MSRTIHVGIDVANSLKHWDDTEWSRSCYDPETKRKLAPHEVRERFIDLLARGVRMIPFGEACEGFDYSGDGCPGHETED